ncbi:unnamed protein product, partial [Tetraodon nigroviridis]
MRPSSVSAVLEKLIRGLCLGDFPCRQNTQAASLRELAVRAPRRLSADFVYAFFTTLRIPEKDLRCDTVLHRKVLELRSNRLGCLEGLLGRPLPCLQYLGLAANPLGSCHDAAHFTGTHWPQLVCLDLGDCEFQEQRALLDALSTLPRLRTLVLEGNPLALAAWYPGLALDRLPQLLCLDSTWISPQDRDSFRGLAHRSGLWTFYHHRLISATRTHILHIGSFFLPREGLSLDSASVSVSVGSLKGIPDPLVGNNAADCPRSSYNYHVTFDFFSPQTS